MEEVKNYSEYLKTDRNFKPDGFDFDINTFENLIDAWTPMGDMAFMLNTDEKTLDKFCQIVYKLPFRKAYSLLLGVSQLFMRKTFNSLARMGNATACSVVAKSFLKLDDGGTQNVNVNIVNDLNNNNNNNDKDGQE